MVDLQGQYQDIKAEIAERFETVLDQSSFINGPEVQSFSTALEKYLDVAHVIPCANGTDALQIAMMGLDLQPGDEVITADFTFAATVEVIALLQLTPMLVDVLPDTFCIDPKAIERAITPKTKAIIPVHLYGQLADMTEINVLAKKYNLKVLEDINLYSAQDIRKAAGLKKNEKIDLIVGGPPCQAFSTAGKRLSINENRGVVFLKYLELINENLHDLSEVGDEWFGYDNTLDKSLKENFYSEPTGGDYEQDEDDDW